MCLFLLEKSGRSVSAKLGVGQYYVSASDTLFFLVMGAVSEASRSSFVRFVADLFVRLRLFLLSNMMEILRLILLFSSCRVSSVVA